MVGGVDRKKPMRVTVGVQDHAGRWHKLVYRAQRDPARSWTERKYAMWARGEKLPSQIPSSMMRCPRGENFDSHDPERSYIIIASTSM